MQDTIYQQKLSKSNLLDINLIFMDQTQNKAHFIDGFIDVQMLAAARGLCFQFMIIIY